MQKTGTRMNLSTKLERKEMYKSARCCLYCRQLFKADSLRRATNVLFTPKNFLLKHFLLYQIFFSSRIIICSANVSTKI